MDWRKSLLYCMTNDYTQRNIDILTQVTQRQVYDTTAHAVLYTNFPVCNYNAHTQTRAHELLIVLMSHDCNLYNLRGETAHFYGRKIV